MTCSQTMVGLVAASMIALGAPAALAADAANPDWPCVQHKVATLTAAQMWDGRDVDDLTQWRDNEEIRKLIAVLASRRVPLEEAAAAIARFAQAQPQDKRDDALKLLFAGLLSTINSDRAVVMSGIERFQQRQKARAAEIERQGTAIRQLKERAASDEKARSELTAAEEQIQLGRAGVLRAPAVAAARLRGAGPDRAAPVRARPRDSLAHERLKAAADRRHRRGWVMRLDCSSSSGTPNCSSTASMSPCRLAIRTLSWRFQSSSRLRTPKVMR